MAKNKQSKKEAASAKQVVTEKPPVKNISADQSEHKINRTIYLLIFLISFLMYGNTIPNEYAMDDELVTLEHPLVSKGIGAIPQIFTSRYVQNDQQSYEYRPIVLVSFAIEHQFTGGNVHFSHFINILLYALTGVLLFMLLSKLFIRYHWILPASVTFLFLLHPLHSEVVASLKNRDELLSFLFTLLSISAILKYYERLHWKYLVFGLIYFLLAMFSKKSAVPLVITLPVLLYFFKDISFKKSWMYAVLPMVAFFLINFLVNKSLEGVNRPGLYFENPYYVDKPGLIAKLPMIFYSMGYYVKLFFIPYPLLVYYGYSHVEIESWGNIWVILSALFFIVTTAYCLYHFKKKNILIFGFLYFLINIGTFSNIKPMPGIIADRFAYGASLGLCIVVCYGLFQLLKINIDKKSNFNIPANLKYASLAIVIVCSGYIIRRNKDWHDHLSIYMADYEKAPNSAKINALIGGYCMQTMEKDRNGKLKEKLTPEIYTKYIKLSRKHFQEALVIFPDYVACLNNLGTLYYSYIGNLDSAKMYFDQVIALEPEHVQANFNMGSYYEIEVAAYQLMEQHLSSISNTDSLVSEADLVKSKEFYSKAIPIYRTGYLAFNDLTKTFQQFINDSRNSGGKISAEPYIANIDQYWQNLVLKFKLDPSQSLNPGREMINAITTSTLNNPNEFSMMLRKTVFTLYQRQFESIIFREFSSAFGREISETKLHSLLTSIQKERIKTRDKMIVNFNAAFFAENPFTPAYQKLIQIYTEEKMWKELADMNLKLIDSKHVSRLTDIYRNIGTGFFYSNKEKEGINYFEMSIKEELKILKKIQISLQQQSQAGNSLATQKLNQILLGCKNNLYTLHMNTGAMYHTIGDSVKANEYGKLGEQYKN
jgi:molybdopterin-biosynthesis enzyme MoeA-like protein